MIIYITQKQAQDKHGQMLDVLETKYIEYFLQYNLFPQNAIFLPVNNSMQQVVALTGRIKPDLIIFTGGNNVKPVSLHDQTIIDDLCPARDEVEKYLIQYADENNIPKLAICRGFQFLNVYYGGGLSYFLPEHAGLRKHLCRYQNQTLMVNSYHQHGVYATQLSTKLKVLVYSSEELPIVEAYVNATTNISPTLGVQWHPEREHLQPDLFKVIWENFINESGHISGRDGKAAC